jgi:hypothetical protein
MLLLVLALTALVAPKSKARQTRLNATFPKAKVMGKLPNKLKQAQRKRYH